MTWLLLSGDLVDARKTPHDVPVSLWERDRVRLSLEQNLNAANDREGHCATESLRDARGLRPVRVQMGRNRWLSLDGCWSPLGACLLIGGLMSLARSSLLLDFLRLLALVRLQPGERARFPVGVILAESPDGLSVPVVRSGNTGKSRFLEASLAVAVPIPFHHSRRTTQVGRWCAPISFQLRDGACVGRLCADSERAPTGVLRGVTRVQGGETVRRTCPPARRGVRRLPVWRRHGWFSGHWTAGDATTGVARSTSG